MRILLVAIWLQASSITATGAEWAAVTRLAPGQRLSVRVEGRTVVTGKLARADQEGITLESPVGAQTLARSSVRSVALPNKHTGLLIGMMVAAMAGTTVALYLATGSQTSTYTFCPPGTTGQCRSAAFPKERDLKSELITAGAAAGVGLPFVFAARPKTIYEAKKKK